MRVSLRSQPQSLRKLFNNWDVAGCLSSDNPPEVPQSNYNFHTAVKMLKGHHKLFSES